MFYCIIEHLFRKFKAIKRDELNQTAAAGVAYMADEFHEDIRNRDGIV